MPPRQSSFNPVRINKNNTAFKAHPLDVPKNSPGIVGNMWKSADNLKIDTEGEPEND